jgi:hypothetical protein
MPHSGWITFHPKDREHLLALLGNDAAVVHHGADPDIPGMDHLLVEGVGQDALDRLRPHFGHFIWGLAPAGPDADTQEVPR